MNSFAGQWATLIVRKRKGGRAVVVNDSNRGVFRYHETYYNHQLKHYPEGMLLNVVIRISPKGRRMIKDIYEGQRYELR